MSLFAGPAVDYPPLWPCGSLDSVLTHVTPIFTVGDSTLAVSPLGFASSFGHLLLSLHQLHGFHAQRYGELPSGAGLRLSLLPLDLHFVSLLVVPDYTMFMHYN